MVRGRRLIRAALGVAGVVGVAAAAVFGTQTGQTWLVCRALGSRPDWHATVDSVRMGWGWVEVRNLAWRKGPVAVRVPAAKADVAVWPLLFSGRWDFEAIRVSAAEVVVTEPVAPLLPTVGGLLESISRGFGTWELPLALDVGQIEVAGTVRAPGWPAAAALQIRGAGPGTGREARLEFGVQAETGEADVAKVGASGTVIVRMRSARRPELLAFEGEVRAAGKRWPQPVRVSLALSANDHGTYQDYRGTCWTDERPLVAWGARMTDATSIKPARMTGTWMLDVREGDLAPLLPGSPLSALTVRSEGAFAADEPFSGFDLEGDWHIAGTPPPRIWPQWLNHGPARSEGRFRLRQSIETSQFKSLSATLEVGAARATLANQREFEVRWPGGFSLVPASAESLATLDLDHWPWTALPSELAAGEALALGPINGRFRFWPRDRGWVWQTEGMLTTDPRTAKLASGGDVRDLQAKAEVTLKWLPEGWQLEATRLALVGEAGEFGRGDFKSGRLIDNGQPLKLAGNLTLDLNNLGKSVVGPLSGWRSGKVTADFAASLGQVRGWRVQVESPGGVFHNGAAEWRVPPVKLDARVETDATGRLVFDLPLALGEGTTMRDVRAAGTLRPEGAGERWEASVSGQRVRMEDLRLIAKCGGFDEDWLARLLRGDGRLGLRFGSIVLSGKADLRAVEAELVARDAVGALSATAAWSEGGQIALKVQLRPQAAVVRVGGEVSVQQMGARELWQMAGPFGATPVEGSCDGSLRFEGTLTSPLANQAGVELVSRGGVFHGLPVSFVRVAESTNRLTSWIASAGLAFNALTGRSTEAEIAGRSQAVAELVRGLNPINYDQFTVRAERGGAGEWRVRELALIAPELRLLGEGSVGVASEEASPVALTLLLRARGRTAELLQYLGVLQEQRDTLGYSGCSLPVRLAGTLARPDATELNQHLAALSIEKPGMVDKALEFLGRWRSHGSGGGAKP